MTPSLLLTLSISTTFISSVALSAFLLARARAAPGAKQLAAFVVIVGLFALGLVLPERIGEAFMALAPLGSALAVDFAIRLTGQRARSLPIVHAFGLGATLLQLVFGAGAFFETTEGLRGFRYEGAGLVGVAVAISLAAYGNGLMAFALRRAEGKRRREIAIVLVSSLVGLSTVVSFAPPLFGVAVAPWSILALPIYPALLVYGILRYELMAANVWARHAAAYALILLLAAAVAGLLAAAPLSLAAPSMGFASLWLVVAAAMTLAFAFGEPIRRAADRLVYAGPEISAEMIAQWRGELAGADSPTEAIEIARTHLRASMRPSVDVTISGEGPEPALHCIDTGSKWEARLAGFEDSPPGARRVAIVYADILTQSLDDIDRRRSRAESERLAGDDDATIAQLCEKRVQGEIRLLAKAREKPIPLAFEEIGPVAAHAPGRRASGGARSLRPFHDAGDAYVEAGGDGSAALSACDRRHDPLTKIERIGSSHPCWPPSPSMKLESKTPRFGNPPRFSQRRKDSRPFRPAPRP